MTTDALLAPIAPGLHWMPNGQVVLSGALLELADAIDRAFVHLAHRWEAEEYRFPTFIPAAELDRIDYFRSFPHLATFPACLASDDANIERFCRGQQVDAGGNVQLTATAPTTDVLTPAACYHLYVHHQLSRFDRPRYFTTRNTCFRRETHYVPLERLWSFTMREVVCMGTAAEVGSFLTHARALVDAAVQQWELSVDWVHATDSFFRAPTHPKYMMQKVDPTKHELVFAERLALASVNLHHDHFGRAFGITRTVDAVAQPAYTGCIAFGIERWLAAFIETFGSDPLAWPPVDEVFRDG